MVPSSAKNLEKGRGREGGREGGVSLERGTLKIDRYGECRGKRIRAEKTRVVMRNPQALCRGKIFWVMRNS